MNINGIENINQTLSTHYLIYKITNNINGKYYIGQHQTNDPYDDYMGSGKILNYAKNKYGLSAFSKNILFDFDNFDEMKNKKKELVQLSNCYPYDQMSYNLKEGGNNGILSESSKEKGRQTRIKNGTWPSGKNNPMYGKDWRENKTTKEILEHNKKISNSLIGNTFIKDLKQNNPERYKLWLLHLSESKIGKYCGKNHPMYGKNPLANMTPEAFAERSRKISIKNKLIAANRTDEEKDKIINKRKKTLANKSQEAKQIEHENRSKATSGKNNGMYGKSINDFLTPEQIKQRSIKLSINNGMHGHSVTDFMSPEKAQQWKNNVANIWKNLSEEKKNLCKNKRKIAMTGKKWYHTKDNSYEKMFNQNDIIPDNFIKGRLPKTP